MGRELKAIADRHADAMEAHGALTRAMREAESAIGGMPAQPPGSEADGARARSGSARPTRSCWQHRTMRIISAGSERSRRFS